MPRNQRHSIKMFTGSMGIGAQTEMMDIAEATSGILHIEGTATAVITLQASPDSGATWHNVYRPNGTGGHTIWIATLTGTVESFPIPLLPRFIRLSIATAAISKAYIEGLRDA